MQQPPVRYKLMQWNFDLLDAESNVVGDWRYYCYSGYHDAWEEVTNKETLARVVARQGSTGHKIAYGMNTPEVLYSYFELLTAFFGKYQKVDVDTLVDEIINHNQYSLPLDMPVNVCYGTAAIIRYLWEDPRLVYNFITLREKFPDESIARLFLIGHSQSLITPDEINSGHSFITAAYYRDVWARKDVDYPKVFERYTETPITAGRFVNDFSYVTQPWIDYRKTADAANMTYYKHVPAERESRLMELINAS